jgi:uncharacterized cupredoxin-like copper-binding protein
MIVVSGCSAPAHESSTSGDGLPVIVHDFGIDLSGHSRVAAGDVRFAVQNQGPEMHELIVVRSDTTQLPLRSDGMTVDEDRIESSIAGSFEDAQPGEHGTLQLHLEPGHYVLFCNMAGHYQAGMHADLDVQ